MCHGDWWTPVPGLEAPVSEWKESRLESARAEPTLAERLAKGNGVCEASIAVIKHPDKKSLREKGLF